MINYGLGISGTVVLNATTLLFIIYSLLLGKYVSIDDDKLHTITWRARTKNTKILAYWFIEF